MLDRPNRMVYANTVTVFVLAFVPPSYTKLFHNEEFQSSKTGSSP